MPVLYYRARPPKPLTSLPFGEGDTPWVAGVAAPPLNSRTAQDWEAFTRAASIGLELPAENWWYVPLIHRPETPPPEEERVYPGTISVMYPLTLALREFDLPPPDRIDEGEESRYTPDPAERAELEADRDLLRDWLAEQRLDDAVFTELRERLRTAPHEEVEPLAARITHLSLMRGAARALETEDDLIGWRWAIALLCAEAARTFFPLEDLPLPPARRWRYWYP